MTEEPTPDKPALTIADVVGIKPIEEMTKDELIDEIIRVNRVRIAEQNIESLKLNVLDLRIRVYKDIRVYKEEQLNKLRIKEAQGFLGSTVYMKDDNENGEQT